MSDDATSSDGRDEADNDPSFVDEATSLAESAAELGLGAVIAPFTGGETVPIVASVAGMLEAGVDRLTHLGQRESRPEPGEDGETEYPAPDEGLADHDTGDRADDVRE